MSEYKSIFVKKKYQKPLSELNWLLDKWNDNFYTSKHQKCVDKIENWFKCHNNILASELNHDLMTKVNVFDANKYGMKKLRFQGK